MVGAKNECNSNMTNTIWLSYIIPFYNGQDTIRRALESIYAIDVEERNFEVIVVDDYSPQPAEEALKAKGMLQRVCCMIICAWCDMLKISVRVELRTPVYTRREGNM